VVQFANHRWTAKKKMASLWTCPTFILCFLSASAFGQTGSMGIFSNAGDVGKPSIAGTAAFSNGEYRITGSGTNIWGKRDEFHYVWREISGNFSATATLRFEGTGNEHRKAGIMVRQSQDADAAFADVTIHGSGMPALQWRSKSGDDVNTFDLPFDGPGTFQIRLVRTGVKIFMYVAKNGGELEKIANTEVTFRNPVLVGLAVCAHQPDASATVVFSDVSVQTNAAPEAKVP
jgi:TolB protein